MNPQNPDIFTRISDPEEIKKIFQDLALNRSELMAKLTNTSYDIYILEAHGFQNSILDTQIRGASLRPPSAGTLIFSFQIGSEKYFFQSDFRASEGHVTVSFSGPLYHLQRREDYRLRIPSSYFASLEVSLLEGQAMKLQWEVLDLSAGGCLVKTKSKDLDLNLKTKQILSGTLRLKDRDPISLECEIRHLGKDQVGLHFLNQRPAVKNRISAIVMDLYREFFTVSR